MAKEKKEKKEDKKDNKNLLKNHPLIKSVKISEKSALGIDKNQYTFNVSDRATKNEIKKAIKTLYKVDALKVNIVKNPSEKVFVRGKWGKKQGLVKAVVFLKKGDKIDIAM